MPADIPKNIEVDISHLVFGIEVRVKDLPHSDKLKFLTDENQMIAHITTVKEEVVAAPEAVADAAATPAEPEVIKKGKQEVEGEGEAEGDAKARQARKGGEEREEVVTFWLLALSFARRRVANGQGRENRDSVKLIVGLGNPGIEYQFTPHNLGFLTIDRIANRLGIEVRNRQCQALTARAIIAGEPVILAKPETYMNLSGVSVRELVKETSGRCIPDLIVIYDELDLPLGTIRIRSGAVRRGTTGWSHSGLLARASFCGFALGIAPDRKVADGVKYVLTPFRKAQGKSSGRSARRGGGGGESDFEGRTGGGDEPVQPQDRDRGQDLAVQEPKVRAAQNLEITNES